MKQVVHIFIWATISAICLADALESPKECIFGTPEYNESLCIETCAKDIHLDQVYCANFTQPIAIPLSTPAAPSTPEAKVTDVTGMPSIPQETMGKDIITPEKELIGSGVSPVMLSVPCLFLSFFVILCSTL